MENCFLNQGSRKFKVARLLCGSVSQWGKVHLARAVSFVPIKNSKPDRIGDDPELNRAGKRKCYKFLVPKDDMIMKCTVTHGG